MKNKHCHLYRICGVADHIHIIIHLHPSVSLADLVKDIKLASDDYKKKQSIFPYFNEWNAGYGGFMYTFKEKDRLIAYVMNQEIHHQEMTYIKELMDLLEEHGIEYDERYLL